MGVPFQDLLNQVNLEFTTEFLTGVESIKQGIDLVWEFKTKTVNKPGTLTTVMGFLNEMPLFRQWDGERRAVPMSVGSHSITVKPYEWTVKVGRDDIKFDKQGILSYGMSGYGIAQQRLPSDLINDFQNAGTSKKCFNGQNFYDSSQPNGFNGRGGTFQNRFTSMDLTPQNLWTQYEYMTQLVDGNGKRMGIRPNILEFGPGMINKARTALTAEFIGKAVSNAGVFDAVSGVVGAAAVSNTAMGLVQPQYNPDLTTGMWYLHDTRFMKPFLYMVEQAPTGLITRQNLDDPSVWSNKEFLWGSDAYVAATCTIPQPSQRNEV